MKLAAAGLKAMSPVTTDGGTVEIADFAKMT